MSTDIISEKMRALREDKATLETELKVVEATLEDAIANRLRPSTIQRYRDAITAKQQQIAAKQQDMNSLLTPSLF
ncbi:hypothetical protein HER32_06800 [Hymenobacter sp. BT18]|uniref:hypothetical protein n=1 Tax=Hymenobacter sp. BT18 TaxID=2835648 RepID=UPI00143E7212|nr:hypothetical protein [Hymenobacter sp. BT18]QIX60902.1 hypothetical protein HER32_06800 [Hymenobacter sp. BT18]